MTGKIGFILLTHTAPEQVVRLVGRLNEMFDLPPIVCHHDFSQCDLPVEKLGGNVTLVRPHLRTQWAEFPVVEATERALALMYGESEGPDWFVLLSGADYPIKPAQRIIDDLAAGQYDAHLHYEHIDPANLASDWQRLCYYRYFGKRVWVPHLTRKLRWVWRSRQIPPFLVSALIPFSKDLGCYAGSQWFSANRRCARQIIDHRAEHRPLADHGRQVQFSEEFYFQTILANAGDLKLHNENYRFLEWSDHGVYPKVLGLEDVDQLIASPSHFARKFAPDRPQVLAAIDDAVDKRSLADR